MARTDPFSDRDTVLAFGRNIHTCCELIGVSLESLALQTNLKVRDLQDYIRGEGRLSNECMDAVTAELRLTKLQLMSHYGSTERQHKHLQALLVNAGHTLAPKNANSIDAEASVQEQLSSKPPVDVRTPEIVVEPTPQEEPMQQESTVHSIQEHVITWDTNDLIGHSSSGATFNLIDKTLRAAIIGRVRVMLDTLSEPPIRFGERAKMNHPNSWWRNVEVGQHRIHGTDVESIAEALGISVFTLLSGKGIATPSPAPVKKIPRARKPSGRESAPQNTEPTQAIAQSGKDARQNYFRSLVLSENTELAPGVKVGQLLMHLKDQENADWQRAFLECTVAGHAISESIHQLKQTVDAHDEPIRALFRDALIV